MMTRLDFIWDYFLIFNKMIEIGLLYEEMKISLFYRKGKEREKREKIPFLGEKKKEKEKKEEEAMCSASETAI